MNKSLFNTFALLLTFPTLLPACKFGNYQSPQPAPSLQATQWKSEDLYYTSPTAFQTSVTLTDNTTATNSNASLHSIPNAVLSVLSNPVYFTTPSDPTQNPALINIDTSNGVVGFYTQLNSEGQIVYNSISSNTLLYNQNCSISSQSSQVGSFNTTQPGQVVFGDGSTAPVLGHLILSYSLTQTLYEATPGACDADLNTLATCYTNGSGCSANELATASALLDLFVKETGILDINNTVKLKTLEYTIQYQ